ncbi:MAG: helix-turn-helix transcriptional regulator [Gemmataceae bacterium]
MFKSNPEQDKILKTIGAKIADLRVEHDWTQTVMAEKSELHRTFIARVERGSQNLAILTLFKIAKALDVNLSDLLPFDPTVDRRFKKRQTKLEQ